MIVEVINTGTELLLGEILNTNFQYLSRHLNNRGFDVLYQTTVGDNERRMEQVIHNAMSRADMIITTGGLGPTRGDITKDIVMKACNVEGYLDQEVLNKINAFFAKRKTCKASNNDKQAIVPIGATVLNNEVGTAPGLWLEHNDKIFVMLPGPPSELMHVCEKQLWPLLDNKFAGQGIILSRVLHLRGIGESTVAELIDDLIVKQTNPTLAIYARRGEIIIRITAKAVDATAATVMLDEGEAALRERLEKYIYGVDDETLASYLGKKLLKQHKTISFAESCTGGLASNLVTDIAGSSEYLIGSIVTYTNEAKHNLLKVKEETLNAYGAISEETALEMAQGVRKLFGSDFGVGITGNAGPGGSEGKPVGLVYIAIATPDEVYCKEFNFTSTRIENKLRIALTAISMVIDKLSE